MKVICVTGVSGAGKTRFSKKLAKQKGWKYLDVNKVIEENDVVVGYDKKLKSKVVDVDKLNKVLVGIIKKSKKRLIVDSHLSHYLDKKYVDKVIVVKCDIKKLRERLKKKKYSKVKIEENVEAEIMDVCYNEAKELGHRVETVGK